ncbi:MAG: MFS transporter [Actinomycetota bacterium]
MATLRVLGAVFRNPELRRVELAFVTFNAAEWGTYIAMLVYAYEQGGTTTAGLVATAQLVPAGLFAPFAGVLADRHGPARLLMLGYVAQAVTIGATAVALFAGAPPIVVYVLGGAVLVAITLTRPAQSAVIPGLARSPEELTATNVVSAWIESASIFAAPAGAGILLGVSGPGAVFGSLAVIVLLGAFLTFGLRGPVGTSGSEDDAGPIEESIAGFRLLARDRPSRTLVTLLGAQYIGIGALDVLYVVLALGVLGLGQSGAGYLNAAFGAGGVLGIAATAALVGRRRLAPPLLAGLGVWALSLWALAAWSTTIMAFVLLATAGAGRSLLDVAGRTLLQRTAPTEVLSRIFGVLEGLANAGLAIGSILVPVLVAVAGAKAALIGVGAVLPLIALAAGRNLLEVDRSAKVPVTEIALLRSTATFGMLGAPGLERLARGLTLTPIPAGAPFIREGDEGDRAYIVADGELEVSISGKPLAMLHRGDLVGEIALLRGGIRTASVTALADARLYALDSDAFFEIVGGSRAATGAMDSLIDQRLGEVAEVGGRIPQ